MSRVELPVDADVGSLLRVPVAADRRTGLNGFGWVGATRSATERQAPQDTMHLKRCLFALYEKRTWSGKPGQGWSDDKVRRTLESRKLHPSFESTAVEGLSRRLEREPASTSKPRQVPGAAMVCVSATTARGLSTDESHKESGRKESAKTEERAVSDALASS
ncbi:hypothetical protein M427DRAFT_33163 [Gonapodya prolifera JEL478]|uniref:Uncharacterized protein n=1 Tax=Gonapodya prolifera (strain JEL478) TaxID=1344416 RepID=A0A139ACI6_GONPJ|nr:hypothetical protein M427DRAFT_33163 [Gonapodya prolifera JEL478]|eukprot:KXS14480.1 hypothetical protein M427DRAFT_33163 [Gonapodya prolifera JEL478]